MRPESMSNTHVRASDEYGLSLLAETSAQRSATECTVKSLLLVSPSRRIANTCTLPPSRQPLRSVSAPLTRLATSLSEPDFAKSWPLSLWQAGLFARWRRCFFATAGTASAEPKSRQIVNSSVIERRTPLVSTVLG